LYFETAGNKFLEQTFICYSCVTDGCHCPHSVVLPVLHSTHSVSLTCCHRRTRRGGGRPPGL